MYKQIARLSGCVIFFFTLINNSHAQVVEGVLYGVALDKTENAAKSIINDAQYSADTATFKAAQQVLLIVAEARRAYKDSLDEFTDKIEGPPLKILSRANYLVSEIDDAAQKNLNEVDGLMNSASSILSDLPFASDDLKITRVKPTFIVGAEEGSSGKVFIEVTGSNLNLATRPEASVEGHDVRYDCNAQETLLRCAIPLAEFREEPATVYLAVINIHTQQYDSGWFDLGFFKKLEDADIPISVYILPRNLGTWSVDFTVEAEKKKTQTKSVGFKKWSNSNTSSDYNYEAFPFAPDVGWLIDTESVRCSGTRGKKGSVRGVQNLSQTGFQCVIGAKGQGFGKGRGSQNAVATWRQYQYEDVKYEPCEVKTTEEVEASGISTFIENSMAILPQLGSLRCIPSLQGDFQFNEPITIPFPTDIPKAETITAEVSIQAFDGINYSALDNKKIPRIGKITYHKDRIILEPDPGPPN